MLLGGEAKVAQPGGSQIAPIEAGDDLPELELRRGQEMKRAAHRPGLHQAAFVPECILHAIRLKSLDARPEGKLRRGHQLGLHAPQLSHDFQQIGARCPSMQVVPSEAIGHNMLPGHGECGGRVRRYPDGHAIRIGGSLRSLYFLDPNGHKLEIHVSDLAARLRAARQDPWEGLELFTETWPTNHLTKHEYTSTGKVLRVPTPSLGHDPLEVPAWVTICILCDIDGFPSFRT